MSSFCTHLNYKFVIAIRSAPDTQSRSAEANMVVSGMDFSAPNIQNRIAEVESVKMLSDTCYRDLLIAFRTFRVGALRLSG